MFSEEEILKALKKQKDKKISEKKLDKILSKEDCDLGICHSDY